jgi:aspartate aminotransferase
VRGKTRLAKRLEKINPSSTLSITSRAKKLKAEGKDVISFAAGEPDFDTPDFIKDAAVAAIKSGFTKYTPSTSIPELKKLICEKFKRDNRLDYKPEQIVVSCGAKHSIFNTMLVLVDPGDEVLIPSPYWVSYPEIVNLCGGKPRFIKTFAGNSFKVAPKDLERNVRARTKLFVLNSPSNPAGCVYERGELQEIADICARKNIFVISDEIYENIIFDGLKHDSIAALHPEIYNLTVTINGLSKSHSMTGWRIGYLGAPADIAEAVSRLQDHSTSNPSSISQKAAQAALADTSSGFSKKMAVEFQNRRDYVVGRLQKIRKLSYILPHGAFYIFCGISKTKLDSGTFAARVLDEALVAVIPGSSFGKDDYIRMSFATGMKQIEEGMNRIENWVGGL